jgi:hypothetical protein
MIQIQTNQLHRRNHSCDSAYYVYHNRNQSCISEIRRMSQQQDAKTVVGDEDEDKHSYSSSWLTDLEELYAKYSFAVVLENKGNTARDHLGKPPWI